MKSSNQPGTKRPLHYKHPSHPVHSDVQPILSAYTRGFHRIAVERFNSLVLRKNLVRWEQLAIRELVRSKLVASGHLKPTKWDQPISN